MSAEFFMIGVLVVLLIGQQVFWSRLIAHMSAKLMSRNYYEYVQTEKLKNEKPALQLAPQDDEIDPQDEAQAQKLNTMFGMV